ncbi:MAG: hypothetical protein ABSF67_14820 [Roseiarcus sp.]
MAATGVSAASARRDAGRLAEAMSRRSGPSPARRSNCAWTETPSSSTAARQRFRWRSSCATGG